MHQYVLLLVERLRMTVAELVMAYACVERVLVLHPTTMRVNSIRPMLLGACVIASTHALSFACALTRATYASTSASIDALTEPGEPSLAPPAGASTRRRARAASAAAASLASRNARAIDASDIFARRSRVAE